MSGSKAKANKHSISILYYNKEANGNALVSIQMPHKLSAIDQMYGGIFASLSLLLSLSVSQ